MESVKRCLEKFPPVFFTFITLGVILWLTLAPKPLGDNAPSLFPGADKIVHGIMFGFFTIMMILDWQRGHNWNDAGWPKTMVAILISTTLGVMIEVAQLNMNLGRGFEWEDMIADGVGAITCGVIYELMIRRKTSQTHNDGTR